MAAQKGTRNTICQELEGVVLHAMSKPVPNGGASSTRYDSCGSAVEMRQNVQMSEWYTRMTPEVARIGLRSQAMRLWHHAAFHATAAVDTNSPMLPSITQWSATMKKLSFRRCDGAMKKVTAGASSVTVSRPSATVTHCSSRTDRPLRDSVDSERYTNATLSSDSTHMAVLAIASGRNLSTAASSSSSTSAHRTRLAASSAPTPTPPCAGVIVTQKARIALALPLMLGTQHHRNQTKSPLPAANPG